MEGGIAILLLFVVIVVAGIIGAVLYFTGGAVALSKDKEDVESPRPEHKEVTSPELEHTHFGSRGEDR